MNNKKTILVATYFRGQNFGSNLQAFALQTFFKKLGFNVLFIEERPFCFGLSFHSLLQLASRAPFHPKLFRSFFSASKFSNHSFLDSKQKDLFAEFQSHFNVLTVSFREAWKLAKSDEIYACVCGSDQVWNSESLIINRFYFLVFSPDSKKIAYGPSLGRDFVPFYNQRFFKKYLHSFSRLSCREDVSVRCLSGFVDKQIELVCDPTLLFTKSEWIKMFKPQNVHSHYLLAYFLNQPNEKAVEFIKKKAQEGNTILFIGPKVYDTIGFSPNFSYPTCSVECFPGLIFNADYILTDSYHGVLFALIGKKQFSVFSRNYKVNDYQKIRFESLFRILKIQKEFNVYSLVDYTKINGNIESFIASSRQYLLSSLINAKEQKEEVQHAEKGIDFPTIPSKKA